MGKKIYKKPINRGITKEGFFIGITAFIIVIAITGILETWNDILFLPGTVPAHGTIVSCQVKHNEGGYYCGATISFETQSSQHITFYEPAGDSKGGDTVIVRYHPNNPQDARIDWLLYDLTVAGIGFGLLLVNLCIFLYWKRRRACEHVQRHKKHSGQTQVCDRVYEKVVGNQAARKGRESSQNES